MVSLYSGTPGSGKSLHVAMRIFDYLFKGRTVVANFPVDLSKISKKTKKFNFIEIENKELSPERLISISKDIFQDKPIKENYILLVIDEAQIIYNSREWARDKNRMEWLQFYSQHRKFGFEVILVAQYDGMIDKQIRSMIEYNVVHRKVSNFGKSGKIMSLFSGGNLHIAVKFWYPLQEKVGSEFFKSKRKYWQIYDSYKMFEKPDGIKDPRKNLDIKEKQLMKLQIEIEELKKFIEESDVIGNDLPQETGQNK